MEYEVRFDPIEARVFGVLVEKALTTPDQYPLSTNAATNGCNQKTNRDPVLTLEEHEVAGALTRLADRYLARRVFPGNSRVEKFAHNGKEALGLEAAPMAVLAELLLRGPQTPGELRARAARMAPIDSLEALAEILARLIERGYVRRLDPAPGSRAERYEQLVSPDLHPVDVSPTRPAVPTSDLSTRVDSLELQVEQLRRQLELLAQRLGQTLE